MSKSFSIMIIAALFFIQENNYYGWNLTAQSDAEMVADGMELLPGVKVDREMLAASSAERKKIAAKRKADATA